MARPKCPNHGCEMSPTSERRIFICPVSDYEFECDVEDQEGKKELDKFGKPMIKWIITGDEE